MKHVLQRMLGRSNVRLLWAAGFCLPLFQLVGCSLMEPRNLARIGFTALLSPINDQVFDLFASFGGGF